MAYERHVLLNHLLSQSVTRAPRDIRAPTHSAAELLEILKLRCESGTAFEFGGGGDAVDEMDETLRFAAGRGSSFYRISSVTKQISGEFTYYCILIEHVDPAQSSFPVVNTQTFRGRELAGEEDERGASAAHIVVRVPNEGNEDLGKYRCAIEYLSGINRKAIEVVFCRQLRRHVHPGWTFQVEGRRRGNRTGTAEYKYTPKLILASDVGRSLRAHTEGTTLTHMVFTKRSERQNVAQSAEVIHEDVLADVELRISAKQAPVEADARYRWAVALRRIYEDRGFESKLYFRHAQSASVGRPVHAEEEGATDLILCPKELVSFEGDPKRWRSQIDAGVVGKMIDLLERDEVWQRGG